MKEKKKNENLKKEKPIKMNDDEEERKYKTQLRGTKVDNEQVQ